MSDCPSCGVKGKHLGIMAPFIEDAPYRVYHRCRESCGQEEWYDEPRDVEAALIKGGVIERDRVAKFKQWLEMRYEVAHNHRLEHNPKDGPVGVEGSLYTRRLAASNCSLS